MKRVNACFVINRSFTTIGRPVCEFSECKFNVAWKYDIFLHAYEYSCSDFTECYSIHM